MNWLPRSCQSQLGRVVDMSNPADNMAPCTGDAFSYNQLLNLSTEATEAQIEDGWKKAIAVRHPDHSRNETARLCREEDMKNINEVKRILLNAALRHDYDRREFVTPEVAR